MKKYFLSLFFLSINFILSSEESEERDRNYSSLMIPKESPDNILIPVNELSQFIEKSLKILELLNKIESLNSSDSYFLKNLNEYNKDITNSSENKKCFALAKTSKILIPTFSKDGVQINELNFTHYKQTSNDSILKKLKEDNEEIDRHVNLLRVLLFSPIIETKETETKKTKTNQPFIIENVPKPSKTKHISKEKNRKPKKRSISSMEKREEDHYLEEEPRLNPDGFSLLEEFSFGENHGPKNNEKNSSSKEEYCGDIEIDLSKFE